MKLKHNMFNNKLYMWTKFQIKWKFKSEDVNIIVIYKLITNSHLKRFVAKFCLLAKSMYYVLIMCFIHVVKDTFLISSMLWQAG